MHRIRKAALIIPMMAAATALALAGCAGGSTPAADETPSNSERFNAEAEALLPDDVRASGELRIGTNAPNPPMWFVEENDNEAYSGVEYDLITAISEALGLEPKITNQNWDGLMPAVIGGRFDVIIGSIGDRPERREQITFVDYGTTGKSLLVRPDDADGYTDHGDMCGKSIGYQTGSSPGEILKGISDEICGDNPIDIRAFAEQDMTYPALSSGQIDAIAIDTPQAFFYEHEGPDKYKAVLNDLSTTVNYGIGIQRGKDDLALAVQAALQGLIDSGEYMEIYESEGIEATAIERAMIDSAP